MAVRPGARIPVPSEFVFPHGVFATGGVQAVEEFVDNKKTGRQETDPHNGMPVWSVAVLDGDPELNAKQKSFAVKISAAYQPVLPDATIPGLPFIPVQFEGLTVTPYVDSATKRLVYSYRATGVGPVTAATPAARTGKVSAPAGE